MAAQDARFAALLGAIKKRFAGLDFGIICDDSGSEGWPKEYNPPADSRFKTVWGEQTHALQLVVDQVCAVDEDGVELSYINYMATDPKRARLTVKPGCDVAKLQHDLGIMPRDSQGTHMWVPLRREIDAWLETYDANHAAGKPTKNYVLLFFTDGQPGSARYKYEVAREMVFDEIEYLHKNMKARGLSHKNFSIQFIQVGKDKNATKFLNDCDADEEDSPLKIRCEGCDYVDTTKFDASVDPADMETTILKIMYGSTAKDLDGDLLKRLAEGMRKKQGDNGKK